MFSLTAFLKGILIQDTSDRTKQFALQVSPSATTGTTTTLVAAQTANRTLTLPDNSGTVLTTGAPISPSQLTPMAPDQAVITDGSGFLTTSPTTATEIGYVSGVTSNIQTQLNSAAVNPMTTLGDMLYTNSAPGPARLPGNTTATKNFLTQTGNGTISAAPAWGTIQVADVPILNQNTTGNADTATTAAFATLAANVNGIVSIAHGGTGQASANNAFNALSPMTTQGDMIIESGSNTAIRLPIGATGTILKSNGTIPVWSTVNAKTQTILTTGTGATYTTPANCLYLIVRMVGGGAGGGGATGNSAGNPQVGAPGSGGTTIFGSSTALGGSAPSVGDGFSNISQLGGSGGSGGTIGTGSGFALPGNPGGSGGKNNGGGFPLHGGVGGSSFWPGAGKEGIENAAGNNATGRGCGGSGSGGTLNNGKVSGSGGGGAEYLEFTVQSPSASYTYTVGAGGTGSRPVNTGTINNGGDGLGGMIIVDEYY